MPRDFHHSAGLIDGHFCLFGDFFDVRFSAESLREDFTGRSQPAHCLDHMDWYTDGPRMVGDCPRNRLPYPPSCVGAEFVAAAVFVLVDGAHKAGVTFLNEVEEAEAPIAIFFGDGDDESKIGAGEDSFGFFVLAEDTVDNEESFL